MCVNEIRRRPSPVTMQSIYSIIFRQREVASKPSVLRQIRDSVEVRSPSFESGSSAGVTLTETLAITYGDPTKLVST